jgi:hypothetical protein
MTADTTGKEKGSTNYTAIREELSSGEKLSDKSLGILLSIGLEHVSGLIEGKEHHWITSEDVKKYVNEVILWRMVRLHDEAVKHGIVEAESIILFGELKDAVCKKLSLEKGCLSEDSLSEYFAASLDSFYNNKPTAEVMEKITFMRKFAAEMVPSNPQQTAETIHHILD